MDGLRVALGSFPLFSPFSSFFDFLFPPFLSLLFLRLSAFGGWCTADLGGRVLLLGGRVHVGCMLAGGGGGGGGAHHGPCKSRRNKTCKINKKNQ